MTHRATHQPNAIEKATIQIVDGVSALISDAHATNKPPMSEIEFRQLIAGYFENKTLRDWCEALGVDPPPGAP